jgi:hypothetical protein
VRRVTQRTSEAFAAQINAAGGRAWTDEDGVIVAEPPRYHGGEPTPEQMADRLRADGLPIRWDGSMYRNTETGDAYDGASGEWVRAEYAQRLAASAARA